MPASPGSVLVVAEELDATADLVVAALAEREVPVIRFDLADFPQHITLAATHTGHAAGWQGTLRATAGRSTRLEEVRAVYYRRPGLPRLSPAVAEEYRDWARAQALVGMVQVLSSLPVEWMHHPDLYRAAAHKPGQLAAAATAGLSVPRTLITNSLPEARAWARTIGGPLACKPITAGAITLPHRRPTLLPTRRIGADDLDDTLELTCHLLQEWVETAYEVRLTVVGDTMFPVAIHAHSDAARTDWRADYDALTYEPTVLPVPVAAAVRRLMAHYQLNYGAIDFGVTPDGRWRFYEINPAGQWQFIAAATGLPIAQAHAELLAGPTTARSHA